MMKYQNTAQEQFKNVIQNYISQVYSAFDILSNYNKQVL